MTDVSAVTDTDGNSSTPDAEGAATPKREGLSFRNTSKKAVPGGYRGLASAINELGLREHPAEWGMLPGWHSMPYRFVKKSGKYCRFEYSIKNGRRSKRLIERSEEVSNRERKACSQLYVAVRKKLVKGLESKKTLKAFEMEPGSGKLVQLTHEGIWAAQLNPIFYAGVVIRNIGGNDQLRSVLIEEHSFSKWLKELRRDDLKDAPRAIWRVVGEVLSQYTSAGNYKVIKRDVIKMAEEIALSHERNLGGVPSDEDLRKVIPHLGRRGRPNKSDKTKFEADHDSIVTEIIKRLSGRKLMR